MTRTPDDVSQSDESAAAEPSAGASEKRTDASEKPDGDEAEPTGEHGTGSTDGGDDGHRSRDIVASLEWGAVLGLGLVALVAVFQFYFAASRAIGVWISPDFEPIFQAAFNLAVLLLAAAGIGVFAQRRQ